MNVELLLFHKKDVYDYNLLRYTANGKYIEVVKFLVELYDYCLYRCDRHDEMPTAFLYTLNEQNIGKEVTIQRLEIMQYLLEAAVTHDAHHPSIGDLFRKIGFNPLVL